MTEYYAYVVKGEDFFAFESVPCKEWDKNKTPKEIEINQIFACQNIPDWIKDKESNWIKIEVSDSYLERNKNRETPYLQIFSYGAEKISEAKANDLNFVYFNPLKDIPKKMGIPEEGTLLEVVSYLKSTSHANWIVNTFPQYINVTDDLKYLAAFFINRLFYLFSLDAEARILDDDKQFYISDKKLLNKKIKTESKIQVLVNLLEIYIENFQSISGMLDLKQVQYILNLEEILQGILTFLSQKPEDKRIYICFKLKDSKYLEYFRYDPIKKISTVYRGSKINRIYLEDSKIEDIENEKFYVLEESLEGKYIGKKGNKSVKLKFNLSEPDAHNIVIAK